MKLTTDTVKTLTLPEGVSEKTYFDDGLPGFGLRVRDGGSRNYILQYDIGGRTRRMTLGSTAVLDLGKARSKAKELLAGVRLGRDVASEKLEARARAAETFGGELLTRFLDHKRAQRRHRSFTELERHLVKYAKPLHPYPVTSIDRRAIAGLVASITTKAGPVAANCALGSLSAYFTWLLCEGVLGDRSNPAAFVNRAPQSRGRDRVLTAAELRDIWNALGEDDYSDIVRLLIFTAARKTELGNMTWDELGNFDRGEIHLAASRVKNNRPHIVVLSRSALAVLQKRAQSRNGNRQLVFGRGSQGFRGWSFGKKQLDNTIATARAAAGIEPMPAWVLHDLRRFFSTVAHEQLGFAPHICEAVLGHVSGFKAGVAGVYNKSVYLDERRRALEKWATLIEEITTGKKPAQVLKLHR